MPKRKQYEQADLISAISAVKTKRLTVSQSAREYSVPRKTLDDHTKGKFEIKSPGPAKMLTKEEEVSLLNYMKYMAERGFPLTRAMLRCFVVAIIKKSGRDTSTLFNMEKGPSHKWIRKFLIDHPEFNEKVPEMQDKSRTRMSNSTVMNQYFTLLEKTVEQLKLQNRPSQIFNCDESGFSSKEKCKTKVIALKGRHSYQQTTLSNQHITAHVCVSADGRVLPPFVIFQKYLPHRNYRDGVPNNWLYGTSDTGYMDSELFEQWFTKLFVPYCGSHRPVLLIFDNHDSHINASIIEKAKQNDIHIIGLPPHTTHILQPLDVGIFGPVKEKVRTLATTLGYVDKSTSIGKAKFPALLSTAIGHICSPAKIKDAFKKCGMFPINRDAIDKTQIVPQDFQKTNITNSTNTKETEIAKESDTPSCSSLLCHSCGADIVIDKNEPCKKRDNPLFKQGLIPESLVDVLCPPSERDDKKKSKKIVTEARVITGDEMIEKLREKEEEVRKKEEEKEKKRVERESNRERQAQIKESKRIERESKRAERERLKAERERLKAERERERRERPQRRRQRRCIREDVNETVLCGVCERLEPDVDEDFGWYQCEKCDRWFHQECVPALESEEDDFICSDCIASEE